MTGEPRGGDATRATAERAGVPATEARPLRRSMELTAPRDLFLTLAPLRHGKGDPTIRFERDGVWRATRTPIGPATERLEVSGRRLLVTAWGPGAAWVVDSAGALVGEDDEPSAFRPRDSLLRDLDRRFAGMRMGRSAAVLEALLPSILEQKVTGVEARRAYRALLRTFGERAPGPVSLLVPPSAETLARLPYYVFHPLGVERRRAETIGRVAAVAGRLEGTVSMPVPDARRRLRAVPGIGPWTEAEVARTALGDPDAVSVGDFHVPTLVTSALAGEPRGDDARMLELLEPYRGQRGRVVRLLEAGTAWRSRRAPRAPARSIAAM